MNEINKYLRYAIKHEIKGRKLPVNMPNLCPICMSPEIAGLQRIRSSSPGRKYVFVPLCSEHYYFNKRQYRKIFGILIIFFILNSINFLIIKNSLVSFVSFVLILFLIVFLSFKFALKIMKSKNIKDFLDIKHSKNIITILIKHSDWAKAFTELNQCEYRELDEQLIKELDPKIVKIIVIFIIWIGFTIFITVVSGTIIQEEWLKNCLGALVAIGFLTIGSVLIYYHSKQERMKTVYELIKNQNENNNQNEKKH